MTTELKLNRPWLVAVWPGMGNVALNAGIYLLAKLNMSEIAEFNAGDLFDIEHVEVKNGIIQPLRQPRNRFFVWKGPAEHHDLVVFLGETQPPIGKYPLCRQIVKYAQSLGVERLFTFAAMATRMHPEHASSVYGAATDDESLNELRRLELNIIEDGNIGGLNGILLGAAREVGLRGACLLGEMPHIFSQLPFPKASQAILEVFGTIARIDIDLTELAEQARLMDQQLGELLARVEQQFGSQSHDEEHEPGESVDGGEEEPSVSAAVRQRIDELLEQARHDRSKSFELKQELDRAGLFKEYEDRFLDLFKKPE